MRSLYLLTGAGFPQGHSDDQALFQKLGSFCKPQWLDWTQPLDKPLESGSLCLIRTTWEYHERPQAFVAYLRNLESQGVHLWNPLPVVTWNMNKNYLLELQSLGVTTVASVSGEDFLRKSKDSPATRCVLKPKTGASAFGVKKGSVSEIKMMLAQVAEPSQFLVQDYVPSVESEGESSLIFYCLKGKPVYSHATRKRAKLGDFRVQAEFGGSDQAEMPETSVIGWAEELMAFVRKVLGHEWLYARVDILYIGGRPVLGELEMIEPQLFHRYGMHSVELMLRAIQEKV